MNTQTKKSTQIFQGIFTGIGMWIFGHLLSGRLAFVENIELYPTGPLVILFPFVFAGVCILIAKHSVGVGKDTYFITSMICFWVPVLCLIISMLLGFAMEINVPVISHIFDILQLIFIFPSVATLSIYYQFLYSIGTDADGIVLILISVAYLVPMIVGTIVSIKIYKDEF